MRRHAVDSHFAVTHSWIPLVKKPKQKPLNPAMPLGWRLTLRKDSDTLRERNPAPDSSVFRTAC